MVSTRASPTARWARESKHWLGGATTRFAEKVQDLGESFTTKRVVITIAATLLAVGLYVSLSSGIAPGLRIDPAHPIPAGRKVQIEAAFQHAWDGYSKHCFGHDELHPVTNGCEDNFGGWGATAIDSLSTAILMRKEVVVLQILRFIAGLDFDVVKGGEKVQTFEVMIRHMGGMISAWDLLDGPFSELAQDDDLRRSLYDQMIALGDRLSCAFTSPSGLPYNWVNPSACEGDSGTRTSVAGAGTIILEFARLSDITGDPSYKKLAEKAEGYLLKPKPASLQPFPGLLGSHVSLTTGRLQDSGGSWGAYADSFYEYLIKAYLYNSEAYGEYLERWLVAVDSTIRSVGSHPLGRPELTLLPSWSGTDLRNRMESLSWFAGGNFILGGMVTKNQTLVDYGLSIADAAGAVYNSTVTGLGGEFVTWTDTCDDGSAEDCDPKNSLRIADARFKLRPEAIETWYYAYRATRDPKYRDWAWSAFEAINRYCRTDTGFSAINDVNAKDGGSKTDKQESFILAEVFKYIYLVHLEDEGASFHVQDSRTGASNSWVFNTEAHPLRIVGPQK